MPYFDYKCPSCNFVKEMNTLGQEVIDYWCDNCNIVGYFKKQLSAPLGFILKGQGFYRGSSSSQED